MPLNAQQIRDYLISKGENPDDYDIDSAVNNSLTPEVSPNKRIISPSTSINPPDTSALGTLKKVGKRSIIPTLTGGGAFALTAAALAPETGGLSLLPLLGAGLVGGGTSLVTSKLQEEAIKKVEGEEKYKQDIEELQKAREAHPAVAFGAEVAPGLLLGGPSKEFTKGLVTGGAKLLGRKALTEVEKQALKTGTMLAGTGAATDVALQGISGEEIDPKRALLAGGTGLMFTKPQLLGKTKLFGGGQHPIKTPSKEVTPETEGKLPNVTETPSTNPRKPFFDQIDLLTVDGTLTPERATLLKTAFDDADTSADFLNSIGVRSSASQKTPALAKVVETSEGEFMKRQIILKQGISKSKDDFLRSTANMGESYWDSPRSEPVKNFLHEYAHIGYDYSSVLTPEEKASVKGIFDSLTAEDRLKYLSQGLDSRGRPKTDSTGPTGVHYLSKDHSEFFAEAFAEWVMANKVPDERLRPIIIKVYEKFKEALKRILDRAGGEFKNVDEAFRPLFEKVLKGQETSSMAAKNIVLEGLGGTIKGKTVSKYGEGNQTPSNTFPTIENILNFSPEELHNYSQENNGLLETVKSLAKSSDVEALNKAREASQKQYEEFKAQKNMEGALSAATKMQTFREAVEIASGKGGAAEFVGNVKGEAPIEEDTRPFITEAESQLTSPKPFGVTPGADNSLPNLSPTVQQRPAKIFQTKYEEQIPEHDLQAFEKMEDGSLPKSEAKKEFFFGPLRAEIDKIKAVGTPTYRYIGDRLTEFYRRFSRNEGKFIYPIVEKLTREIRGYGKLFTNPKDWLTMDNESNRRVLKYLDDMQESGGKSSGVTLTESEVSKVNFIRQWLRDIRSVQNSLGIPVWKGDRPVTGGFDPNYMPQTPNTAAVNDVINHPNSPRAKKLIGDFFDYQISKGMSEADARKAFNEFISAYGGERPTNIASQFGPIDKAQGIGLPESWRDSNLINRLARYGRRVSRRFAYHEAIESDPISRTALGIKTAPDGSPTVPVEGVERVTGESVQEVLKNVAGQTTRSELKRDAAAGIVRAALMGTGTGAVDFTTNLTLGFQHFTPKQTVTSAIDAFKNLRQNLTESYLQGVNRINIGSLETNSSGMDEAISALHRIRDITNELQGRNFFERMSRATAFGQGKFVAMDNLWTAHKNGGNIKGQGRKFLDDFGPSNWQEYIPKGEFPPAVLNEIAAKYVESVQGTYDYRGLPKVAVEGTLSPFLSLSRWNIEKANNFARYVITPAINGNWTPFLMSTIGMLLGGTAVTKLRELMSGKTEKTPSGKEIFETAKAGKGITKALTYKMLALADAAGYAGFVGNIADGLMARVSKNNAQGFTNPLIYGISESYDLITEALQAINDGSFDVGVDLIGKIMEQYLQSVRIGIAALGQTGIDKDKQQELKKVNYSRNLKVFKQLYDYPIGDVSNERENPFSNSTIRRYKETENPQEALGLLKGNILPSLLSKYRDRPELLRGKLEGLQTSPPTTLPNIDNNPRQVKEYLDLQKSVRGGPFRDQLVRDYLRNKALAEVKNSLVPSL